jgi:hypothetical protein
VHCCIIEIIKTAHFISFLMQSNASKKGDEVEMIDMAGDKEVVDSESNDYPN